MSECTFGVATLYSSEAVRGTVSMSQGEADIPTRIDRDAKAVVYATC